MWESKTKEELIEINESLLRLLKKKSTYDTFSELHEAWSKLGYTEEEATKLAERTFLIQEATKVAMNSKGTESALKDISLRLRGISDEDCVNTQISDPSIKGNVTIEGKMLTAKFVIKNGDNILATFFEGNEGYSVTVHGYEGKVEGELDVYECVEYGGLKLVSVTKMSDVISQKLEQFKINR